MAEGSVKKIAVIGAESTGKSWLCEKLAAHFNTVWVPEYAREYFNDSDIYNYSLKDLQIIAARQIQMENDFISRANKLLFCDTNLITLKIWAELEFGKVPDIITEGLSNYDYYHTLVTDNSQPWEPDAQRQNKFSREMIFEMNRKEVENLNSPFSIISENETQRIQTAVRIIDGLNW